MIPCPCHVLMLPIRMLKICWIFPVDCIFLFETLNGSAFMEFDVLLAYIQGNPYRLIFSVDSKGRICGRDVGVE